MKIWIPEESITGRLLFCMHANAKSYRYNKIRHEATILMLKTAKISFQVLHISKSTKKFILAETKGQHDVDFILRLLDIANVTVTAFNLPD